MFFIPPSFGSLNGAPGDNAALAASLALKADLEGGKVPASQLPSYVDDVVEYANAAAFPGTGAAGVIYVALDTSKTYRWSGSAYVFTGGSLAAASQAEMEAGTEAAPREMSPLLVAQAIAALGVGGGGGTIALPLQAWVETTGNDGTGAVGDPALPYQTMMAAYTAGARLFHIGAGNFDGLSVAGEVDIRFIGSGRAATQITTIESTDGSAISIQDLGDQSATIGSIANNAPSASSGDAVAPGAVKLHNLLISGNVTLSAGAGADGTPEAPYAGAGANAPAVELYGANYVGGNFTINGGNGGNAGEDVEAEPGNGGNGGHGGSLVGSTARLRVVGTISGIGGSGGLATNGGSDGAYGNGSAIDIDWLRAETVDLSTGGEYSYIGFLTARHAYIGTLNLAGSTTNLGGVDGTFIFVATLNGSPDTTNLHMSKMSGTYYGNA